LAEGEVYAWRAVTIHFPCDPWQRAGIRDALLILTISPAAVRQVKPHSSPVRAAQLSLRL
jgi:hypothetical protein